ncbi:LysM peptidoglycan-binding domain-containing protein [Pedobacter sp. HMF7056]|uniref:Peptidoglycan hydrolase n=2 Tax=Hufsiella ginkgonis TaxID=2695274 RepID=A0A7K1XVE9_9SPHI|nr:LysM peptidoglycan-binding domain-containing protein [Hufsiella ginkgonis]
MLASCSSKKQVVKSTPPAASQPPKRTNEVIRPAQNISENILVKKYTAQEYIERFKAIAITEMDRYGIPASITLAQGLLESGNGNGTLARVANNHFGIKCNTDWQGKIIYQEDDIKDDCFRVYNSPEESFRDHSEFLKRKRYAFLFELDKNDFTGWANGLKQAGYATNPQYANLLISLVQRYQLDQYDRKEQLADKEKREDKVLAEIAKELPQEIKKETAKEPVAMKIYEVKAGDTLYAISKRFGISVDDIKILNNISAADIKPGQLLLVSK